MAHSTRTLVVSAVLAAGIGVGVGAYVVEQHRRAADDVAPQAVADALPATAAGTGTGSEKAFAAATQACSPAESARIDQLLQLSFRVGTEIAQTGAIPPSFQELQRQGTEVGASLSPACTQFLQRASASLQPEGPGKPPRRPPRVGGGVTYDRATDTYMAEGIWCPPSGCVAH